jgi:hypothetical protein
MVHAQTCVTNILDSYHVIITYSEKYVSEGEVSGCGEEAGKRCAMVR